MSFGGVPRWEPARKLLGSFPRSESEGPVRMQGVVENSAGTTREENFAIKLMANK